MNNPFLRSFNPSVLIVPFVFALTQSPGLDLKAASAYFRRTGGHGLVVMQNGKLLHEEYQGMLGGPSRPHMLASGTKSFNGLMAMAAVEDGLLKLDEKVADTITEWKSDPWKSKMTVEHLLTLTAGFPARGPAQAPTFAESIQIPLVTEPGSEFKYGNVPFQVFNELMRRKLKTESPIAYLERRVLKPMGVAVDRWRPEGRDPNMAGGAMATARDWVRMGEAVRLGGKGVLKPESIRRMLVPTKANPGYALCWWLNRPGTVASNLLNARAFGDGGMFWPMGPHDAFMAAGAGMQRLYVVPSMNLTVVRTGSRGTYSDRGFLGALTGK